MLDLKFIRENPDKVRDSLKAKNTSFDLDQLLRLDKERREHLQEVENLKSKRNQTNDEITQLKKSGKNDAATALIESIKTVSQKVKEIDHIVGDLDAKIDELLLIIPNTVHETVPVAKGPTGNKEVRKWGNEREFGFKAKDHLDLASSQGWLSMTWGSTITGSAFPVFQGLGARLERGLINFMMDLHAKKHGYTEIWPPALVNRQSMIGTGQLPKFEEDMYRLKEDDFFLVPTAEVPVTNLLRDAVLTEAELPKKFVAYSPCFRREAGSYGKDTKGLSRVHQFDKVELVKFVKPEEGMNELELLVKDAEAVLQALELPYRVVLLGSGDMSFAAHKCYDLEVWAPVSQKWFEVSSCSVFADFQSRRINIKFRREATKKLEYVWTLNGSGVALARTVLCLLENFQTQDGSLNLPKALKSYID